MSILLAISHVTQSFMTIGTRTIRRLAAPPVLQGMAAGSRASHADEQSRSRRRRAARRSGRVRRIGQSRAQLGIVRRDRARRCARSSTTRRCWCSPANRSPSFARTPARRACSSPTRCSSPPWATWETFRDLEDRGLTMYGQMTAGSWIYIGRQGIVQGTYETLAALGAPAFWRHARGRLVVTAGLGGMGGAQPLAATMNGAAALIVEVDPPRIEAPARDAVSGRVDRQPRRGVDADRHAGGATTSRDRSRSRGTRPTCCPNSSRAASRPTS